MSSDVDDDQVLPDSLQKLEIVPVYSQSACKANNEHNQNPFFTELSTANGIDDRVGYLRDNQNQTNVIYINNSFFFRISPSPYIHTDNQRPVWANV